MSGGTKSQSGTQETRPWEGQQPYLTSLFAQADKLYKNNPGGPKYFPGETVASLQPEQVQAMDLARQFAQGQGQQIGQQSGNTYSRLLRADLVNTPEFNAAADAAIRPVVRQFNENVLPQIRSGAMQAGQYGGSRQALAEGIAADRLQQNTLDTTARMALDAMIAGQKTSAQALALAPQAVQASLMPSTVLEGVGGMQRNYLQSLIDSNINRWDYGQLAPYRALEQYQNFIGGNFGSQGVTSQQVSRTNPLMAGMGGALTGGTLGMALAGGQMGMTNGALGGPPGMAIGAGAGALIGILGSIM